MRKLAAGALLGAISIANASCADDVDFTGSYSLNVRNEANRCLVDDWTEGETATAIPVEFTQSGESVNARVGGVTGTLLNLVLGEDTFMGLADGDEVELTIIGSRSMSDGNCSYTYTVTTRATLDGDNLSGTITYSPDTNSHPDCGVKSSCSNVQTFNGSRPPTE